MIYKILRASILCCLLACSVFSKSEPVRKDKSKSGKEVSSKDKLKTKKDKKAALSEKEDSEKNKADANKNETKNEKENLKKNKGDAKSESDSELDGKESTNKNESKNKKVVLSEQETREKNELLATLDFIKQKPQAKKVKGIKKDEISNVFTVAKVGSDVVTNVDIMNAVRFIFFASGKEFDKGSARLMVKSILQKLIREKLQEQVAQRNKISIPDAEISNRVKDLADDHELSVEELGERFEQEGINMDIYRKNVYSHLLFSYIIQALKGNVSVTEQEVSLRKDQYSEEIKHARYHVYEIYFPIENKSKEGEVKQIADEVHKLLQGGFNFMALAENVSQGNYKDRGGDLGWISLENMEKPVGEAVSGMKTKEFSNIIRTNTGFKIIFLDDKAEPGRKGSSESVYKYIKAKIQYRGGLFTSKDVKKAVDSIEQLKKAKDGDAFKKICNDNKFEIEEKEENIKNPFMLNILSSAEKKAIPVQSIDNKDYVDVYYTISQTTPVADAMDVAGVRKELNEKKVMNLFHKSFNRAQSVTYSVIDQENLEKLSKIS